MADRPTGILVDMVDGQQLYHWRQVHIIADCQTTLATQHARFANQRALANLDPGMWQIAEVIDMQDRVFHYERLSANPDPGRAGVQIDPMIEIGSPPELDIAGESDPD